MNTLSSPPAAPHPPVASQTATRRRLLVSIHAVSPRSEPAIDILAERLDRLLGGARFAMLVIPDHWREAPIAGNAAFHARLRQWAGLGIEMFLNEDTVNPKWLKMFWIGSSAIIRVSRTLEDGKLAPKPEVAPVSAPKLPPKPAVQPTVSKPAGEQPVDDDTIPM